MRFKMKIEQEPWFSIRDEMDSTFLSNWRDQLETTTINVHELWENTYITGRPTSHIPSIQSMGKAHLETASLLAKDVPVSPDLPSYKFFLTDSYGKIIGASEQRRKQAFPLAYMKLFNDLMKSFKINGYDTSKSMLLVDVLDDGKIVLSDGNKRINCLEALMKDEDITVLIDDHGLWHRSCLKLINRVLAISFLLVEGKRKILYQPAIGYEQYTTSQHIRSYGEALNMMLDQCGNVKEKLFLDVGSCFGYFSFELVKRGAYCIGVEQNRNFIGLPLHLTRMYNNDWSNPKFVRSDISSYISATGITFDYALMFNVFHLMLDRDPTGAFTTLNAITKKTKGPIFLAMRTPSRMIKNQNEVPDVILKNTILEDYQELKEILRKGRILYKFYKE